MKITANEAPPIKGKPFPKLMREKVNGGIVLFSLACHGVRIVPGECGSRKIGYSSSCWDMTAFEDFHGSVTIEND